MFLACQNSHFGICQSAESTCSVLASIVTSPSTCAAGSVAVRCHVSRCCQTQHRSISRQHQPTTADIQFRICKCNCGFGLHKSTSLSSMLSELSPESISGESNQFGGHDAWSSEMHKDNFKAIVSVRSIECRVSRCVKDRLISFKRNSHYPSLAGMHENPRKKSQSFELPCKCSIA